MRCSRDTDYFPSAGLAKLQESPGSSVALGFHQEHRERIQSALMEFLSPREARETAAQVCELALETDEEIGRILKDPKVGRLYEYDGQFFTPRGTRLFHTAFDGLHLLKSLSGSIIEAFFRGREKHSAIRLLLEELSKHAWLARIRRMNWEEFDTLDLVPKDVLEAIVKHSWKRKREALESPPRMSVEEQTFFEPFEKQLAERLG
jgi:hypothetical protein